MPKQTDPLEKIKSFCAYQERSHKEVRTKLLSLKVYGNELEQIISVLIDENFLNEERYACAIARGKFKFKQWGRNKIKQALQMQDVSTYCIKRAMLEIDESDYIATLTQLAEKKFESLHDDNMFQRVQKTYAYLMQKGYENTLIQSIVQPYLNAKH
jgi:regulatory protein